MEEEPEKRACGSGLERLRRAADRKLARNSDELAGVLLEKALEGKLGDAKMLVSLAEEKAPPKPREKKPSGPSLMELAEKWASEPEWVEPEAGDVWTGNGWKRVSTGVLVGRNGLVVSEGEEMRE
jgi:hypothetical protein